MADGLSRCHSRGFQDVSDWQRGRLHTAVLSFAHTHTCRQQRSLHSNAVALPSEDDLRGLELLSLRTAQGFFTDLHLILPSRVLGAQPFGREAVGACVRFSKSGWVCISDGHNVCAAAVCTVLLLAKQAYQEQSFRFSTQCRVNCYMPYPLREYKALDSHTSLEKHTPRQEMHPELRFG